ncbi:esterase, partial [Streptococcus suis]
MHVEFLSHWSGNLGQEMNVNRYGHAGIPVVVFASSGGSYNEYADFGMVEACRGS